MSKSYTRSSRLLSNPQILKNYLSAPYSLLTMMSSHRMDSTRIMIRFICDFCSDLVIERYRADRFMRALNHSLKSLEFRSSLIPRKMEFMKSQGTLVLRIELSTIQKHNLNIVGDLIQTFVGLHFTPCMISRTKESGEDCLAVSHKRHLQSPPIFRALSHKSDLLQGQVHDQLREWLIDLHVHNPLLVCLREAG